MVDIAITIRSTYDNVCIDDNAPDLARGFGSAILLNYSARAIEYNLGRELVVFREKRKKKKSVTRICPRTCMFRARIHTRTHMYLLSYLTCI